MSNEINDTSVQGPEFVLFLILILLIMGNQNRFDAHFELFESKVNKLNELLKALAATNQGLKGTMAASKTIQELIN